MTSKAPVKKEYDIPIIKPEEIPKELPAGVPAPEYIPWEREVFPVKSPVRVPEEVKRR